MFFEIYNIITFFLTLSPSKTFHKPSSTPSNSWSVFSLIVVACMHACIIFPINMMHLQKKFRTESSGNIVKEAMERLWAGDRGAGYGIVCPAISEVTLTESHQHDHPTVSKIRMTSVDILNWMEASLWGLKATQRTKDNQSKLRAGEVVPSREQYTNWLSGAKWSALKT